MKSRSVDLLSKDTHPVSVERISIQQSHLPVSILFNLVMSYVELEKVGYALMTDFFAPDCVFRKVPWRKFPVYMVAQVLGAMAASAIVYANYRSAIDVFEGGSNIRTVPGYSETATAGIFCTYPAPFMTTTGQFFSEFIASTLLMFLIYALQDDGNLGAGPLTPLALFFVIFGIGACFGWETGYAINLARDFGPRLVSYMIGYGPEVWRAGNYYFWVSLSWRMLIVQS